MARTNYFKVVLSTPKLGTAADVMPVFEIFTFDDLSPKSAHDAYAKALAAQDRMNAGRRGTMRFAHSARITVFRRTKLVGPWKHVPLVGDVSTSVESAPS